ncbi:MAG: CDP-alcohol phosphatidyltransferase family protein [Dehalococcoidia bacterium]|nr:CDP-alcohol phosphatidyltransferase family protein [Dehalococcoidia bacterium]
METFRRRLSSLFQQLQAPLVRLLARTGVTPNQVTLLGLLLSVAAAVLASQGWFLWAGLTLAVGSALDMVDGMLARSTGKASPQGALLDSVADRLGEAAVLLGLLLYYVTQQPEGWRAPLLVGLALVNGFLVSYVRARAEGLGVTGKKGLMTRPERVVALVAGLVLGWVEVALAVIALLSLVTWVQRLLDSWRALGRR